MATFNKYFILSIFSAAFFINSSARAANAVIDVLVIYTQGTADAYGGDPTTKINQLFQLSNQIYVDSGVNLELRVAKTQVVNYTDDNSAQTALNDITYGSNAAFSIVPALRDQYKADMVVLYRPYKSIQGSCGVAWINGIGTNGDFSNSSIKNYMFAHLAINTCGDYVTAHELGHNMGLKHSRKQDGSGGTFPYALGYGVDGQFVTIMAYQASFNVDYWTGKIYKFSNPQLLCKNLPCGVDRSDAINGSDAHYVLNITAPQIANFYGASSSSSLASSTASSSSKTSSIASSTNTKRKGATAKEIYDEALIAVNNNHAAITRYQQELEQKKTAMEMAVTITEDAKRNYLNALQKFTLALSNLETQKAKLAELQKQQKTATQVQQLNQLNRTFVDSQTETLAIYNTSVTAQTNLANANNTLKNAVEDYNSVKQLLTDEQTTRMNLTLELQAALIAYRESLRK